MDALTYRDGELYVEQARLTDVAARHGTPAIVYSSEIITSNCDRMLKAFSPVDAALRVAIKSVGNAGVLRAAVKHGAGLCAIGGFELERAWLTGCDMFDVVLAGLGKTDEDLRAALDGLYSPLFAAGAVVRERPATYRGPVGLLVAESAQELERIERIADGLRINCRVLLRVNSDEAASAESKFGVSPEAALELLSHDRNSRAAVVGLHTHVGPSIHDLGRMQIAVEGLVELFERLDSQAAARGSQRFDTIDIGGGFAAIGLSKRVPTPEEYAAVLCPSLTNLARRGVRVLLEPGRAVFGSSAVLVTTVIDVKKGEDRAFAVCDAGINEKTRPAQTEGFRMAWPVVVPKGMEPPQSGDDRLDTEGLEWTDIVGPGGLDNDAIARGRLCPPVKPGDLIAVFGAGAYTREALTTSDERCTPAELLVEQYNVRQTRPRRTMLDALGPEADAAKGW
ncbi:MAG: hypothetical protein AAGI17_07310 [Planctomycetota bacterium]